jgi:hypothetical protein
MSKPFTWPALIPLRLYPGGRSYQQEINILGDDIQTFVQLLWSLIISSPRSSKA